MEFSFSWWSLGPKVPQFCLLLPSWYALWVSLWAFVFLFQKNYCFSSSFIGIENNYAPARITFASVTDIKSNKFYAEYPWIFLKRLRAFIYPAFSSPISKKGWNSSISFRKLFLTEKAIVAKLSLYLVEWMRTNISRSTTLYQQTFQFAEKEGKLPSLLVGNKGFFPESMLLKSTFRFPQFMILLWKKV